MGDHRRLPVILCCTSSLRFPVSPRVHGKVEYANGHPCGHNHRARNIRVHERINVMKQKSALVGLNSCLALEPVLQRCQRARPGKDQDEDSPDQRRDMHPPQQRARSRKERASDYPQNENRVYDEDAGCQRSIDIVSEGDDERHLQSCSLVSSGDATSRSRPPYADGELAWISRTACKRVRHASSSRACERRRNLRKSFIRG